MRNIPLGIRYLIKIFLFGLVVFTTFRIFLLFVENEQASATSANWIIQALLMGIRFDTVVSCYILFLPALLIIIFSFLKTPSGTWIKVINVYSISLYCIAFFICSADIPFFQHYLTRITYSILNWSDHPAFMFKLVFQDPKNYLFLTLFIMLIFLTRKFIQKASVNAFTDLIDQSIFKKSMIAFLLVGFLLLGMRGRIAAKSPIQWGTAFISDNNFVNQLGLNPVFTFIKSYIHNGKQLNFMHDDVAIKNMRHFLGITNSTFNSPVARKINTIGTPVNANVVIVIMESMGLSKTGLDNNPIEMTPYLDSLAKVSYTFTNVFSAGIHTYNGIYATLFSMPALMNEHPMAATEKSIQPFTGIAKTLEEFNYQSVFICPHDEEFDNMSGFLKSNGFGKVIGQKDFPSSEVVSTMGVPDDVLFNHTINELDLLAENKRPFLASILTGSDHKPYYIPLDKGFVPKTKEESQQVVEYADWSINKFLKQCSSKFWYDNTIFVFVADHGSWYRDYYEMNLSYNKIPLIIFAPKLLKQSKTIDAVAGQIDVFPTIMGLLNRPYINNTMGVDILKEGRKYICFSADDKLGCVNDTYFWYHNYEAENEYLLHYRNKDGTQYLNQFPLTADTLKLYAFSMLQTTQWMIGTKKVGTQK